MIRDHFKIMLVDLEEERGRAVLLDGRDTYAGGSGLAAMLFEKYGKPDKPWNDPDQPLIFAIGPLTGYFPLMSKTVCGFKSPYHDQYAESHAGGRSALALRFADYDALVIRGRARRPSVLFLGSRLLEVKDAHFLWGRDALSTGKTLRRMFPGSGHRSILRIGPAGEKGSAMACIVADTFRHFGRLGSGAVMGSKNLKAISIRGNAAFPLPQGRGYRKLFDRVFQDLTSTQMMSKYHNLGTAGNVAHLNEIKGLPWRNLQASSDPGAEHISGERFAQDTLLRNAACSGCPVGCIHIGFMREKFMVDNQYYFRQVAYDYEPIFAVGSMLGVADAFSVIRILEAVEHAGLDVMGAGVALAWATEATQKGLVSEKETLVPLSFGDYIAFREALQHLGNATNEFYATLAQGLPKTVARYGGEDFACVLGQEMAGYATGEVYFVSQALGFRHSHLDTSGYTFDEKRTDKDVPAIAEFLVQDERSRGFLTSMVSCLFARGAYSEAFLAEALATLGYEGLAAGIPKASEAIQKARWRMRLATGFDPASAKIPKRFSEVTTFRGPMDVQFMESLRQEYGRRITALGAREA